MAFAKAKGGADEKFQWFEKCDVNGKKAVEPFSFLKNVLPWSDGSKDVLWK